MRSDSVSLQVYCGAVIGGTWRLVRDVRSRITHPIRCTDQDGPYVRIRWVRKKANGKSK